MKAFQFPLTRITICFVLGIVMAFWIKPSILIVGISTFVLLTMLIGLYFYTIKNFQKKSYFLILVYSLPFCIGTATQIAHSENLKKHHYLRQCKSPETLHTIELRLDEKLKNTTFNQRYIASVKKIDRKKSTGKILINIKKTNLSSSFEIGSYLNFEAKIVKHQPPKNPNQFDYGQYLSQKSIFAQLYIKENQIKIGENTAKNPRYYAAKLRNKIINNLEKSDFNKIDLPVIIALILGQQQDISKAIVQDYQYAGAVHILSVSGLHVGFILLFLHFLLSRFPKNNRWNFFRLLVVFFSLWIFAFISGLSPSVLRSVTMFCFIAVGMYLKRETNIFHTLTVSILLILLVEPSFLFDIGFQLSYISLFFILWLQPLITRIWSPQNKIIRYFWNILTVSFAAQIGTLPLSIYYFHQFPGLFFITNLIILPALGAIMAVGVFVMILAAFDCMLTYPLALLEWMVHLLNKIISTIASFETFVIKDIPLHSYLLISLYLLLIGIVLWFEKPNFKRFIFASFCVLLFQIGLLHIQYENERRREWIVFDIKNSSLITDRIGKEVTIYGHDAILNNPFVQQNLTTYLVANFSKMKQKKALKNVFFFNDKKILMIDSLCVYPKKNNADIVVLIQSPKVNLKRFLNDRKPKVVVADGSNFKSYVALWKATCEKEKIPFHATGEKGFYKLE
jgi:competence protein ComEC